MAAFGGRAPGARPQCRKSEKRAGGRRAPGARPQCRKSEKRVGGRRAPGAPPAMPETRNPAAEYPGRGGSNKIPGNNHICCRSISRCNKIVIYCSDCCCGQTGSAPIQMEKCLVWCLETTNQRIFGLVWCSQRSVSTPKRKINGKFVVGTEEGENVLRTNAQKCFCTRDILCRHHSI